MTPDPWDAHLRAWFENPDALPSSFRAPSLSLLSDPTVGRRELRIRRIADLLLLNAPPALKRRVTGCLKRLRRTSHTRAILRAPGDEALNRLFETPLTQGLRPRTFHGRDTAIVMTHDIDRREGFDYLPELARLDQEYGITPVINLLTHGEYKIDAGLIAELTQAGFEIGLHGSTHALALGAYRPARVRRFFDRAFKVMDRLKLRPHGFRAPGFSISPAVLKELESRGFLYDSSMQLCSTLYHSCATHRPYRHPLANLIELPVSLRDDLLLRDSAFASPGDALRWVETALGQLCGRGGAVVLNFHPCLVRRDREFYRQILRLLHAYRDRAAFLRPVELAELVAQRY